MARKKLAQAGGGRYVGGWARTQGDSTLKRDPVQTGIRGGDQLWRPSAPLYNLTPTSKQTTPWMKLTSASGSVPAY